MTVKLDMSKAYDRVEWSFIGVVMKALDFIEEWIKLVVSCISSMSYSIFINGQLGKAFVPFRELRQGDQLSSYLFLTCVEGLNLLINSIERRGVIQGLMVASGGMSISHLFFADNSILFCKATRE